MRALVLSDIHGNLEALEAVLAAVPHYDELWNLGDAVGYGASPNEVVSLLQQRGAWNVRGNHDKVCCGTSSLESFNPVARRAAAWTRSVLQEETRQWLCELPMGPLDRPAFQSAMSHGSPLDEDQYVLNIRDAWHSLEGRGARTTFFGHTHVQGGFERLGSVWHAVTPKHSPPPHSSSWTLPLRQDGTRYLLNPGAVGQPRDGDWRAAYAVLDTDAAEVSFHREPYDLHRSQGRILMADLPEKLASRLREGR